MSTIPCPACGRPLPEAPTACPDCHLPLTGPDAARLWQVDQTLATLQRERASLIASLRATTATTPPATQSTEPAGSTVTATDLRRTWTTQQTLLAVGVLLVLVAGSIALAIAWFIIGRVGQMLVMGGFTAAATLASLRLSRRHLPSSAEALALVAGGLLILDIAAARRFGLAHLDVVDGRAYTAVSGILAAVALAAVHRRDQRIAGFALLSLTAASIGWAGVVGYASTAAGGAALALLGAVVFGVLHLVVPSSYGLTRRAATGPAAGWTALSFAVAGYGALSASVDALNHPSGAGIGELTLDGSACLLVLATLATAGALTVRQVVAARATRLGGRRAVRADWRGRPLSGDWRAVGVVALVASAAVPTTVLCLALQVGAFWTAGLSLLAAVVATVLAASRTRTTSLGAAWCEAQTGLAMAILVVVTLIQDSRPATIVALAGAALAAATAAVQRPGWRVPATGVAALAAVFALALTGSLVSPDVEVLVAAVGGAALVVAALTRRLEPEEVPLAAVGHLTLVSALLGAVGGGLADAVTISVLGGIAGTTAATALLRPLLRPVGVGVSAATATWALWLAGGLVGSRTQWAVLVLTALALVALTLWRRRRPEELVLGTIASLLAVTTVAVAVDRSWPHAAAAVAAAYGLLAVGYAALPQRRAVVTLAVVALTSATWLQLGHADVTTLEAWSLPPAALLLAAGLWSHRELGDRTWLTAGPGLAVGLLPSALFTTVDDGVLRPLVTVSAAVLVLIVGALRRWQAPVVLGAAAAVVVAVTELGPYAVQLPRYLTLGTLGVALLAVGARYEQRRADARQAVSWLASLS
ncbi:hypothetical protein BJ986_000092 [Phycicoccus badiiscoriae]|uniref:DUF2157 domain-containing protein n=1 Tax=Pedococcus badiiscoriae TaxID=642776 RepID=A0A852WH60_9MICO|nr:hypothetical protein [Pedococcus badiiscoriae]NYG05605.1 hypothetical protein [Pedococcus badiiscoriae]